MGKRTVSTENLAAVKAMSPMKTAYPPNLDICWTPRKIEKSEKSQSLAVERKSSKNTETRKVSENLLNPCRRMSRRQSGENQSTPVIARNGRAASQEVPSPPRLSR